MLFGKRNGMSLDTLGCKFAQMGSVPANDGESNSRYVSCSKPSLHHHKAPPGAGAIKMVKAPLTLTLMALYK